MLLPKNLRLAKPSPQFLRAVFFRQHKIIRHDWLIKPGVTYNLTKPEVDLSKHDPDGVFSESVLNFIKARDFENSGGRKVDVVSLNTGEKKGTIEVNDFVFAENPRIDILHRNVVWYRASIRVGMACVKRRSEVRGGGRKPWPQKGLGKARHGSIRSPLWRGGGSAKGPKPRDYSYELPFSVRRMGLRVALSCRLAQGDLVIVDDLSSSSLPQSSHELQELLDSQNLGNCHLVDAWKNDELDELTNGLEKVTSTEAMLLHVYGILIRHKLVISLDAVRILEEKLCEDNRIINSPEYELYHQDMMLDKKYLLMEYNPKFNNLYNAVLPRNRIHINRPHLSNFSRRDLKR